ncbi:chymase-like [Aricia agestis]|uniref:chymase-like n=1 Tax=Aricia agestis TaxID=91739 RepID=UPI001C20A811|nr:chymase-like [Aricia agestis]
MVVVKYLLKFLAVLLLFIEIDCDENDIESRVVDGQLVPIRRFPHVAFLRIVLPYGEENVCGGSIVNQFLLVTAAHCMDFVNLRRDSIWAYVGHENIDEINIIRSVKKKYIHEDYDPFLNTPISDIALLLLKEALPLHKTIQRILINIQFPSSKFVTEGYLAGWGLVDEVNETPTMWLRSITQELLDPRFCYRILNGRIPGTFCGGSKHANRPRPAMGDSGSGLISKHRELLGVMSVKSAKSPSVAFYTNVTSFYSWLVKTAQEALQSTCGHL